MSTKGFTHGFGSSQSESEAIGRDDLWSMQMQMRERERKEGLGCLVSMKLGEGIYTIQVRKSDNVCYVGKR
jgi:hypothetical protein